MTSFIDVLPVGLSVLGENWKPVLVILSVMLVSQFAIHTLMKSIFGDRLDGLDYVSLSIGGWLLPATLVAILWYVLKFLIFPHLNSVIFLFIIAVLVLVLFIRVNVRSSRQSGLRSEATLIGLLIFVCASIPLRLAFVSDLPLPQYFDSTRHYAIIDSILGSAAPLLTYSWWGTEFYHVGFHVLAAFTASLLNTDISKTMLVLGQMILVVAPLAVFFPIRYATRSNSAAVFAVLLSGFGWSMPAYALNWGKYPAVASLALFPFLLSAAHLAAEKRHELTKQKSWTLYTMLASAIAVCGFLHTRSLVAIAIAFVAWVIAGWWQDLPELPKSIVFATFLLGILSGGWFIYQQEILEPLFNPYVGRGFYSTVIVLLLSIFAKMAYPRWTFANLAAILFLFCALFIPTTDLFPRLADRTLLDRPFVEMLLYLPLSLLGGFGLAALAQLLTPTRLGVALRTEYIGALFITFLIGNAILQYDFRASNCCSIAGRDDMQAMSWIREHVPDDAHILISVDELDISASNSPEGYAPTDAGAWITPLTGRTTVPLMYDTNLDKDTKFESLCKLGVDYIYVGGVGLSFHAPRIKSNPHWYKPVLSISRVEVYQVIGCR